MSQFPEIVQRFIKEIKDVPTDGNCGFRVVSDLLGFGVDDWAGLRRKLAMELSANVENYTEFLFRENGRVYELLCTLTFYEDRPAPFDKWMTMPDMGHGIASCFEVVLVFLSRRQCLTFLPLRSPTKPTIERRMICIGYVNDCHFVEVQLCSSIR